MPYKNYIYEYHAKISSGEIIVGKWIKKIFEIIINGLQTQEYFFNAKAANKAIKFIETFCHHSKGRNDLITLELWQKAIVSTIFGIQDAEKIRVFREIFIVIGRKNGKSLFASALIAYMAYLEPEYGQEIYCLAPKLDQAALVYDGFYQMVQAEEELEELAKKRRSDIYIAESNTVIKPIAFNAKKSDGFNPQLVVCDEMAAWSGDAGLKQYEVMKSALGARKQPMILSISTAGYINDSIYDELMKRSTSFLKGNSKERRLLPFLYMIDDVEKWNDIDELKKANPNMGVSVKESFFIDEIAVAEGSLSKKAEFLTKYCNIKQNSSIAWLEYQTVEKAEILKTLEDFRECYAVGGIDLSQTTDLTAASPAIQPVVAVAAHKRHSHAPEIPYYILSTVIFSYVVLSCGGKIPRSPFCCLRSVRHFARKTGRNAPVRTASGVVQAHDSPAIQPVGAEAAHKRHSHNARIQPKVITQIC